MSDSLKGLRKSPNLTDEQHHFVNEILSEIKSRLEELSQGNIRVMHYARRYIYKRLEYEERGTPAHRKKLKEKLYEVQNHKCRICGDPLTQRESELHRKKAEFGYSTENCQLIHHKCHRREQQEKGFK